GIEEILTAPRSPWQNPYVERVIGSIRRDCLNHFVILNTRHLGSTSNVHSLDRFRASAGSSQSRSWAVSITVMNTLQRNDVAADAVLAIDRTIRAACRDLNRLRPWSQTRGNGDSNQVEPG